MLSLRKWISLTVKDATIDNLLEKIFEQLELSTHEKEQIVLRDDMRINVGGPGVGTNYGGSVGAL